MPTLAKSPRRIDETPPDLKASDAKLIAETVYWLATEAFPEWSRDKLLCHPKEAMEICRLARGKLHRPSLTDYDILWSHLNAHKRGHLPADHKSSPRRPRKT